MSNRPDYIPFDNNVSDLDSYDYVPDTILNRNNKDKGYNSHGSKLLDLCIATSVRIANGRLGKDYNEGAFTYVNGQNCSTIDYLLLKECDFSSINNFTVCNFNEFSDHAPLSFSLCTGVNIETNTQDSSFMSESLKWNCDHRNLFRSKMIAALPEFNNIFDSFGNCQNKDTVDDLVCTFSNQINNIADPLFKTTRLSCKNRSTFNKQSDTDKWFDRDCYTAKQEYKSSLREFNNNQNITNRLLLQNKKRSYKLIIRKTRRKYKFMQARNLENLKHSNPRTFWKYFSAKKRSDNNDVDLKDFHKYFQEMFCTDVNIPSNEATSNNSNTTSNIINEELDCKITTQEVKSAINKLKRNKSSAPCDSLLNEYFIETSDILIGHLTDLFNIIFDSGQFPKSWSEGYIVPIYKKGDKTEAKNYRGVTLTSNLGKLFTGILTTRIDTFCENNNKLSDIQYGFRKDRSTVDAIFILKYLIDKTINKNKQRLYCAFVDFKRAFDNINRTAMWTKLNKTGINGKTFNIIRSMYQSVKACVKHNNCFSDFFDIAIGLRQGEKLSPIMFSLFLEDIEDYIHNGEAGGITVFDLSVLLLLFADDMIIFGQSPDELQRRLNNLSSYCDKWGLEVNILKTKITVFRKRGVIRPNEQWTYKGEKLEVVDTFNYLGVVFKYTGSFVENSKCIYGKSLKALNILLANIKKFEINPKTCMQLFDSFIEPILTYSSSVWGFDTNRDLERIHLKFCKRVLGVRDNTSTAGVYGELGRFPLYINRQVHIIKYWLKLIHTDNPLLLSVYENAVHDCEHGSVNWASKVKHMLSQYGFGYAWYNPKQLNKNFVALFKQTVIDNYIQKWQADMQSNQVLLVYKHIKHSFGYANYLNVIPVKTLRSRLTQIRLSSHNLRINTGRYQRNKIERKDRKCTFCDLDDIEDEFHFIFKCTAYNDLRNKYIKHFYRVRPSMYKFIELLDSSQINILNLSKYISEAFKQRNSIIIN